MFNDMKHEAPSVNYHLTDACNMHCKFCFATFNDLEVVKHNAQKSKQIIQQLAEAGFEKITFAGGEPTLVRQLPELLAYAKALGLTTCIVSNGSRFRNVDFFKAIVPNLDWIALSIDSVNDATNIESGRAVRGKIPLNKTDYLDLLIQFKQHNVRTKINTVVSRYNLHENMSGFIREAKPDRWKILQAMPVEGQNSRNQGKFEITDTEYQNFLARHAGSTDNIDIVPEEIELVFVKL
jgi:radical S-adenosyl methionine domain-containing protein 2